MGSTQQIVLGVICLAAAFAFGNYVNNHPPLQPNALNNLGVAADQVAHGNIHSRLPSGNLEVTEKRPAGIATMRQALTSRFSLPDPSATITAESMGLGAATPNQNQRQSLPPPSQLAHQGNSQYPSSANGQSQMPGPDNLGFAPVLDSKLPNSNDGFSGPVQGIEVPDFSAIAAEFNNIPLPPANLGAMPQKVDQFARQPFNRQQNFNTQQQPGFQQQNFNTQQQQGFQQPNQFANQNQNPKPIENLFDQFNNSQPVASAKKSVNVWDTKPASGFSGDDFAPQLKDHLAATGTTFNNQPPPPVEERQNEVVGNNGPAFPFDYSTPPAPSDYEPFEDDPWAAEASAAQSEPEPARPMGEITRGYRGELKQVNEAQWGNRHARLSQMQNSPTDQNNSIHSTASNSRVVRKFGSDNEHAFGNAPQRQPNNRVRTKLPFGLTQQAQTQMATLRSRASSNIALDTTRFVDHVVQQGETLQSISRRYFGKPDYYLDVYLANRNQLRHPAIVPAGIVLKVPVYE